MSEFRTIHRAGTEEEAAVIVGFLQSEGITVRSHSSIFKQEPVTFGSLGDVRIDVAAADFERAQQALERAEASAVGQEDQEDQEDNEVPKDAED